MIFASVVFVAVSLVSIYAQPPMATGTCASIGYDTMCCPQSPNRNTCRASDGNCFCSHDCYLSHLLDCCTDVACARSKYARPSILIFVESSL
jgi:hypothetical protein